MKKSLYFFIAALTCLSCNDDDAEPFGLSSDITIDAEHFIAGSGPSGNYPAYTDLTTGEGTDLNRRSFIINDNGEGQTLTVLIGYPSSQASSTGTYAVSPTTFESGEARVHFGDGESQSSFSGQTGSITVTDLGRSKYELKFNQVTIENAEGIEHTINGNIIGNFIED